MAAVQPRTRPRVNTTAANSKLKPATATTVNHDNTEIPDHAAAAASPLLVFMTNLRLLDLDLLPDWPDVTAETFSTTGMQGQRRRIRCVEWVLVKLFEIWDPEETCSKLNPLFPPHDQVQSVTLRAALLRALDTVKRNGFLGRDTVIRKTMLDDCKGERLEEILAYFSTAVLKRVIRGDSTSAAAHEHHYHHPIAVNIALETRGYDSDNTDLHVLSLAYRSSLRRFLEEKEQTRILFRDFGDLLSIKERSVRRRVEEVQAKESEVAQDALSNNAKEEMRRLVRNNWSGNEKWMETLIRGDCRAKETTGFLVIPFDRVWRRVRQGRLAEIEEDSGGLLEQLESRVKLQNDRLARWNTFRNSTFGRLAEAPVSPSKKRYAEMTRPSRGIDFQFSSHHDLHVGGACQTLGAAHWDREGKSKHAQGYDHLLRGLQDDLAEIKKVDSSVLDFLARSDSLRRSLEGGSSLERRSTDGDETISEMSELENEPPYGGAEAEAAAMTAAIPVRTNRTKLVSLRRLPIKPQIHTSEVFNQSTSTHSSSSPPPRDEELTLRQQDFVIPQTDEFEELEPPPSPTRDSAECILEAMDHASPSPVKRSRQRPTLSLAQRTRLSMAANYSPFLDKEPEPPSQRSSVSHVRNKAGLTPPSEPDLMEKEDTEAMDLVSRTRLSMAGFEPAQKRAQFERQKSLRKSKIASARKDVSCVERVEEEGKEEKGGLDREALTRELIVEEDMEAVFKSRPKMRTSPVGSPGVW